MEALTGKIFFPNYSLFKSVLNCFLPCVATKIAKTIFQSSFNFFHSSMKQVGEKKFYQNKFHDLSFVFFYFFSFVKTGGKKVFPG